MIHKSIEIKNELGLHSRTAALFVQICAKFRSDIYIEKDDFQINAKSIMGIMALGASEGDILNIIVSGTDEKQAIEEIELFFKNLQDLDWVWYNRGSEYSLSFFIL